MTSATTLKAAAGMAAVTGMLLLGGCGSSGTSTYSVPASQAAHAANAPEARDAVAGAKDDLRKSGATPASTTSNPHAVVRTGDVSLTADDVAAVAGQAHRTAARYGGQVADERTRADHVDVSSVRLTLRVPSARFGRAYADLKGLGRLTSATSSTEDVTTQLIDVDVRVSAQRASVRRVQALLDRAGSIRDVLAIEAQLTRRQEALDSLERRQAYLEDQTSLSTITVSIARTHHATPPPPTHHAGFLGGLHRGWHALTTVATAVAAGAGAVLPFGVPLLLVGMPAWWLLHRRRRSTTVATPDAG